MLLANFFNFSSSSLNFFVVHFWFNCCSLKFYFWTSLYLHIITLCNFYLHICFCDIFFHFQHYAIIIFLKFAVLFIFIMRLKKVFIEICLYMYIDLIACSCLPFCTVIFLRHSIIFFCILFFIFFVISLI